MLTAGLMFPALFALILLGLPIAFSLVIVSVGAGLIAFGGVAFDQLYGSFIRHRRISSCRRSPCLF